MRIISGSKKGLKLSSPKGNITRPTLDRAKTTIFNILCNNFYFKENHKIKNAKIADLFAGTGSIGLELLSRGAKHCDFYEQNTKTIQILKKNINKTNFLNTTIYKNALSPKIDEDYNIIFIDPPYENNLVNIALLNLHKNNSLNQNPLIIVQTIPKNENIKEKTLNSLNYRIAKEKLIGYGNFYFLTKNN